MTVSGGAGGFTYLWSNNANTQVVNGLMAGSYIVTVTDANNCTVVNGTVIGEPTPLVLTTSTTTVNCRGGSDGTATVTPTGGIAGYTYAWDINGTTVTSATASNLAAGTYSVTVTDANGCTQSTFVTVAEPATSVVANIINPNGASCNGGNDGSASVSVFGGTTPYTYLWSDAAGTTTAQ